jgi:hypothetical protein
MSLSSADLFIGEKKGLLFAAWPGALARTNIINQT